jgi:glutamate dehydrogenase/leucine dehydrogenase
VILVDEKPTLERQTDDGQEVYTLKSNGSAIGYVVRWFAHCLGRERDRDRSGGTRNDAQVRLSRTAPGGAKARICADAEAPLEERRRHLLRFAQAARPLLSDRTYIPDADLGTTAADIRWMMRSSGHQVRQRDWRSNRSGYYTAVSAHAAAAAACQHVGKSLRGSRVLIQGFGSVGAALAGLLAERGALVVGVSTSRGAIYNPAGLDAEHLSRLAQEHRSESIRLYAAADQLDRSALLELPADILCPCARSHTIREGNAPRIEAALICAGANNPLTPTAEQMLSNRGVLCLPDFVTNCGGVLGGTMAFAAVPPATIESLLERFISRRLLRLLQQADHERLLPRAIAEREARARFEQMHAAAKNPRLLSRLLTAVIELYGRGWVPAAVVALMSPRYFKRLLGLT